LAVISLAGALSLLGLAIIVPLSIWKSRPNVTFSVTTNSNRITLIVHDSRSGSNSLVDGGPLPIDLPYEYTNTNSGAILRVEKDGRHIKAIGLEGRILWSSDPFADSHLAFYRTRAPRIVYIGEASQSSQEYWGRKGKEVVALVFNSSQFGVIDVATGEFMFEGQD
jgi:hypothetical protein